MIKELENNRIESANRIQNLGFDPFGQRFDNHQPIASLMEYAFEQHIWYQCSFPERTTANFDRARWNGRYHYVEELNPGRSGDIIPQALIYYREDGVTEVNDMNGNLIQTYNRRPVNEKERSEIRNVFNHRYERYYKAQNAVEDYRFYCNEIQIPDATLPILEFEGVRHPYLNNLNDPAYIEWKNKQRLARLA